MLQFIRFYIASIFLLLAFSCNNHPKTTSTERKAFQENHIAVNYLGSNQYEVYLDSTLNFENAIIDFGEWDTINKRLVPSDTSNITVIKTNTHFLIHNFNKNTKNGYVRILTPDQTYDGYTFQMTSH